MPLGVLILFFPLIYWIELAFEPLDARNSWSRCFFTLLAAPKSEIYDIMIYIYISVFVWKWGASTSTGLSPFSSWKCLFERYTPFSRQTHIWHNVDHVCCVLKWARNRLVELLRRGCVFKDAQIWQKAPWWGIKPTSVYIVWLVVGVSMKMAVDSCKHARLLLQLV